MRKYRAYTIAIAVFSVVLSLNSPTALASSTGTIDPNLKYAWGDEIGWVNFNPTNGGVEVSDVGLLGYIWDQDYGWINLSPTNSGVKNDGLGNLSGYAWGQSIGWIDFSGVSINSTTGRFTGSATTASLGTITFDCTNCGVITTWRETEAGGSTSTGSWGGPAVPTVPATPTPPVQPDTSTTSPEANLSNAALVNDNGTYYLIAGTSKFGITNPGILSSYGYTFADASPITTTEKALPTTSNLPPNGGALVKTLSDPTVYLISNGRRYGFSSASVFIALGFKFASVVTVTSPELLQLPAAPALTNATHSHLPGTSVLLKGTVYWIGTDYMLHAYPSLAIYNSWNIPNSFSGVVTANAADKTLALGSLMAKRDQATE